MKQELRVLKWRQFPVNTPPCRTYTSDINKNNVNWRPVKPRLHVKENTSGNDALLPLVVVPRIGSEMVFFF